MTGLMRFRSLAPAPALAMVVALSIAACGGQATTDTVIDDSTVTDDSVLTETRTKTEVEDAEPQPGDQVTTEEKVPGGGKAEEEETVAPKKEQGNCAAGEVEVQGGGCIPDQASG